MRKYESLARKREHDIKKAAVKAEKQAAKDNSGKVDRNRPVYLSTLQPPHLQTFRDHNPGARNARSPYGYGYEGYGYGYGYGFPFLVPVPIFFGEGVGFGGCVAGCGSVIDPVGACGGFDGGLNCGGAGCAGNGGEPPFFFLIILYEC